MTAHPEGVLEPAACPFCGSPAELRTSVIPQSYGAQVQCTGCDTAKTCTDYFSLDAAKESVIAAWNRRASPPPADREADRISIPRDLVLRLLGALSMNVCNAGGYDKSYLRACALNSGDYHGKERVLDFENELGNLMPELFDALGFTAPQPRPNYYVSCRCNGRCEEVKAELCRLMENK